VKAIHPERTRDVARRLRRNLLRQGANATVDERTMRDSTTRAALESWLAHAEELLREQEGNNGGNDEEPGVEHGDAA